MNLCTGLHTRHSARLHMDSATIYVPDYWPRSAQIIFHAAMAAPPFNLSISGFTNTRAEYGIPFQPTYIGCSPLQLSSVSCNTYTHDDRRLVASTLPISPAVFNMPILGDANYRRDRVHENLHVKVENPSPRQNQTASSMDEVDDGTGSDATFTTDVDTLMRAIQIKSAVSAQSSYVSRGDDSSTDRCQEWDGCLTKAHLDFGSLNVAGWTESQPRRTYGCDVGSCAKYFFQKTHLEIHMRAHTGYKPFVSMGPITRYMEQTNAVVLPSTAKNCLADNAFRSWEISRYVLAGTSIQRPI